MFGIKLTRDIMYITSMSSLNSGRWKFKGLPSNWLTIAVHIISSHSCILL